MITFAKSDDNADDNGMSNGYERLKRWREKHRGLANLRQRKYRSRKPDTTESAVPPAPKNTIEELRALIAAESARPAEVVPPVPRVFRDDYGRVITEAQWNEMQERKEEAARGGYVIDEFSQ